MSFQPSATDKLSEMKRRTGASQASEINAGIVQKAQILCVEDMCMRQPRPALSLPDGRVRAKILGAGSGLRQ